MSETETTKQSENRSKLTLLPSRSKRQRSQERLEKVAVVKPSRSGISLLPNAITASAAFCGFYAIALTLQQGQFFNAVLLIFAAAVLDSLDGRVARMTNSQSDFGAQFDSMSDLISFGVAPAVLYYQIFLKHWGKLGVLIAFFYCICVGLRLARFNANISVINKAYFQGLPSPAGALLVSGALGLILDLTVLSDTTRYLLSITMIYASVVMVSSLPYYSFKDIATAKSVRFQTMVLVIAVAALIFYQPSIIVLIIAIYAISGVILYIYRKITGIPIIPKLES